MLFRSQILLDHAPALAAHFTLEPAAAGMHLVAALPPGANDLAICEQARRADIILGPLSRFYHGQPHRQGLLLGYAGFTAHEIRGGLERLQTILTTD